MAIIVVGTNYKYSPIEFREKISFSKRTLKSALLFLQGRDILGGAVILSTCNRVEIYASTDDSMRGIREIEYFLSRYHEIDRQSITPYLYAYVGREANKHLSLVASGLDSLILGETQILGQVKDAFSESLNVGFTDELLGKTFRSAVLFARKVHRETELSKGKVSVGSVAVLFLKEKIGGLRGKKVLIIGTGKVTELVLRHLKKEGANIVFVSNRTFEKAKVIARRIGAKAVRFNELGGVLKDADILITATRSPHFVIRRDKFKGVLNHKLFIIDLAVPRNVDPGVGEIENVELFCLEDLGSIIQKNMDRRKKEAEKAEILWKEFIESEQEVVLLP